MFNVLSSSAAAASVAATAAVNMPGGTIQQVHTRVGPELVPPSFLLLSVSAASASAVSCVCPSSCGALGRVAVGVWPCGLWTLTVWRYLICAREVGVRLRMPGPQPSLRPQPPTHVPVVTWGAFL